MDKHAKTRELLASGDYTAALALNHEYSAEAIARLVPSGLRSGLIRHILVGGTVGGFLTALLENDLMEAVPRADSGSLAGLRELCQFVHGYTPRDCHGSREIVRAWRDQGGLIGHAEDEAAP